MYLIPSDTIKKIVEGSLESRFVLVHEKVRKEYPGYKLMATFPNHAIISNINEDNADFLRVEYSIKDSCVVLGESDSLDFSKDLVSEDDALDRLAERLVERLVDGTVDENARRSLVKDTFFDLMERVDPLVLSNEEIEEFLDRLQLIKGESNWRNQLHENAEAIEHQLYKEDGYYRTSFTNEGYSDKSVMSLFEFLKKTLIDLEENMDGVSNIDGDDHIWEDVVKFCEDLMDEIKNSIWLIERINLVDEHLGNETFELISERYSDINIAYRVIKNTLSEQRR